VTHDEDARLAHFAGSKALMVDAEQPDEVGPAALAELQVVGVIDVAGEIGVLVIDADRQDMGLAFYPSGKIRPIDLRHSSLPLNKPN
jgi:hypothetical protein